MMRKLVKHLACTMRGDPHADGTFEVHMELVDEYARTQVCPRTARDVMNARFFLGKYSWLCFFWKSCSSSQDNMLTGVRCSTIKTVIGSQFVQEKLSIALLF